MDDEISPDLFNHLAELAADEAEYLRRQLNNQLKAIHKLETIPLIFLRKKCQMPSAIYGMSP